MSIIREDEGNLDENFTGLVLGGDYAFQMINKPKIKVNGTESDSKNDVALGVIGPMLDWYPDPSGGGHLGLTLGWAALAVSNNDNSSTMANARGTGAALHGGWDFWVGEQWSIGAQARLITASVSSGDTPKETDKVASFALLFDAVYH